MPRLRTIISRGAGILIATIVTAATAPARADLLEEDPGEKSAEDKKDKTEWAAVPVIGGSTDIGFQFGAALNIARVGGGFKPYWWKMDMLLSTSVKGGPRGTEFVQQSHDMRWTIPGGAGGKVRLMPAVFFDKTVNSGYFGLGNAAPVVTDPDGQVGARYQFKHQEIRTRLNVRQPITSEWNAIYGWTFRYLNPKAYAESRLSIDAATRDADGSPLIYGLRPINVGILQGGVTYDTRNDEIVPTRGSLHTAAFRFAGATPAESGVRWMGFNLILQKYHRIGRSPFVLAGRLFVDLMAGHVPFFDLSQAGAFAAVDFPGGAQGIRGVPNGRYSGLVKVVGNIEIRTFYTDFHLFGSHFKLGATAFIDAGRIWTDYTFSNPRDGTGLGLKYGIGGGPCFTWDSAALFRVDLAYSPDASAANPGFPIGIYVQEGFMF